tara:strand:+ start:325 stop:540 length:216 start_codon:yes stop_codon:yes gene_type:complete
LAVIQPAARPACGLPSFGLVVPTGQTVPGSYDVYPEIYADPDPNVGFELQYSSERGLKEFDRQDHNDPAQY